MKLNESIGRFSVRKAVRFSIKKLYSRAECFDDWLFEDESRAAALNTVKAAIEAEHLMMVRRVFKALPDPLPESAAIRRAFEKDPEYRTLSGRNPSNVMKLIVDRCIYNGWTIPEPVKILQHWSTLYVKWHWFCAERLVLSGENSLPRQWEGRAKAEVEKTCPLLHNPKKRKPSRNYWFDHAPFRMLFDNRTCGMSWLKDDFAASRTFLFLDDERIRIGIVPRFSRFNPFALPEPDQTDLTVLLYEETQGIKPRLVPIACTAVDEAADCGDVLLFELEGRAIRGKSNLNAMYLRALFSPENMSDPVFHLDKTAEFHVRKGTDIPRDGKPEGFRQRFTEDQMFVTFHLTLNAPMAVIGKAPQPYGDLARYLTENPAAKLIPVPALGTQHSALGTFIGDLARRSVSEDACVIFPPRTPKRVLDAAARKFAYIVLKDRKPTEDGGVLRGYQLTDRLFVGNIKKAQAAADEARAKAAALERARQEKAERRAKVEEGQRLAALRNPPPDFSAPIFQTGQFRFKVEYKTSDNVPHAVECRADSRDEMYQKAKSVRVRPSRVTQLEGYC